MKLTSRIGALLMTATLASATTVVAEELPEPVEGLPSHFLHMQFPFNSGGTAVAEQHVAIDRKWAPGQKLAICFYGGDDVVRHLVAEVASEWLDYVSLDFDFGQPGAYRDCTEPQSGISQIRVGFDAAGYWSLIGTDARRYAGSYQVSLNLEGFHRRYPAWEGYTRGTVVKEAQAIHKGVIIHEFGHALGFLHEHQNANMDCWSELILDGPGNVYDHYFRNYGWYREKVERNLGLALHFDPDSVSGEADTSSIMAYELPAEILRDGEESHCHLPVRNNQLSELDKAWAIEQYPQVVVAALSDATPLIAAADIADQSIFASAALRNDYMSRIVVDLNSDDTAQRREARSRLAAFLEKSGGVDELQRLTAGLSDNTYRTQLGIAVALGRARDRVDLDPESIGELSRALSRSSDPILTKNLTEAIR